MSLFMSEGLYNMRRIRKNDNVKQAICKTDGIEYVAMVPEDLMKPGSHADVLSSAVEFTDWHKASFLESRKELEVPRVVLESRDLRSRTIKV